LGEEAQEAGRKKRKIKAVRRLTLGRRRRPKTRREEMRG
jgi:hypothetical protein